MTFYKTPNDTVRPSEVRALRQAFMEGLDDYSDEYMKPRILWMIDRLAKALLKAGFVKTPEIALEYATDVIAECVDQKAQARPGAGERRIA